MHKNEFHEGLLGLDESNMTTVKFFGKPSNQKFPKNCKLFHV
jgi:hypothetical protein